MILTTSINGNSHQIFLSQKNALGTHAERAGGIFYVHRCAKVIVNVVENQFCTEESPVRVFSDNSSEVIRYMDPFLECSIEISLLLIATPCTRTLLNCRMGHG